MLDIKINITVVRCCFNKFGPQCWVTSGGNNGVVALSLESTWKWKFPADRLDWHEKHSPTESLFTLRNDITTEFLIVQHIISTYSESTDRPHSVDVKITSDNIVLTFSSFKAATSNYLNIQPVSVNTKQTTDKTGAIVLEVVSVCNNGTPVLNVLFWTSSTCKLPVTEHIQLQQKRRQNIYTGHCITKNRAIGEQTECI